MVWRIIAVFCLALVFSCSANFSRLSSNYQFKSPDNFPDYSDLNFWAAHPWKWDPSDSIPAPLRNQPTDTIADVFFLHPTTYTSGTMSGQNADIDDRVLNAKTDYTTILYQASVFNQHCRVFAPRYRQAHISSFFMQDSAKAHAAFELAYNDLKAAFEFYLRHWNKGRPIIIASHSQGSLHAARLLKEYFDSSALKAQLVTAYIIGWPVPRNYFKQLPVCIDSIQIGCICSWRTFQKGFLPPYVAQEKDTAHVTNPLNWKTTREHVSKKLHRGSVLKDFNKIYPQTTDAQIGQGVLWVAKPDFPGSIFYLSRNYHIGDINLFYINLRDNIAQRIRYHSMK